MTERPAKRPLITANQVTVLRLVPMPVLCWLIYQGDIWIALVLGTLIGCTDFVDGYLARKHGPTVLGGLLDPIADKVFIAFAYLPFADLGMVPAWAVALMFIREFLVTGLRSAYEQRGLTMKTSYFGKVKTWTQMQGLGVLLLFLLLQEHRDIMYGLLIAAIAAPLVALGVLWLVRRRFWPGALIMSLLSLPLLYLHVRNDLPLTTEVIMIIVVVLTWLSGIDYIAVGMRELRGRGDFGRSDVVRLLGAILLPCAIFIALDRTSIPIWALVTILSVELSVGGLDNLLSHHRVGASALSWSLRVVGTSALLLAGLLVGSGQQLILVALGAAATAASVGGVAREFWRGRDYYLDRRLRNQALDPTATS